MMISNHHKNISIYRCAATAGLDDLFYLGASVTTSALMLYLYHSSFFYLRPLHYHDDTAFASTPAACLDIAEAGVLPFNYTVDSYIWEIRSELRDYNPYIIDLSNLHRPCADSSIITL